jgi:flagellin
MGLRIYTNLPTIRALRNLAITDRNLQVTLERLSTGLRINRASDDPSGLVISEQLRGQIAALEGAVENSQNASNLISTADAALQEVSDLLVEIQNSVTFALNTGGSSESQIAAEQDAVDNAIAAIDRIASTTRFSDRNLLNGNIAYTLVGNRPDELNDLRIRRVSFAPGELYRTFTVTIKRIPQRAEIVIQSAITVGSTTLRITGLRGTEDITIASSTLSQGIATAINSIAGYTGVFASGTTGAGHQISLFSEDYGLSELIKIEIVSGKISGVSGNVQIRADDGTLTTAGVTQKPLETGEIVSDRGLDAQVLFAGQLFTAEGRDFSILTNVASIQFSLDPDEIANLSVDQEISFTVGNTGLTFQLSEMPKPSDRINIGIDSVASSELGFERYRDRIEESIAGVSTYASEANWVLKGGFLNSLKTGGDNDLTSNPQNASEIVGYAINQVATLRGFLGAVQADSIQPNIDSLNVHIENLTASLSTIRDVDFAEETANYTKYLVLLQSGIAVLEAANNIPQRVLTLLT